MRKSFQERHDLNKQLIERYADSFEDDVLARFVDLDHQRMLDFPRDREVGHARAIICTLLYHILLRGWGLQEIGDYFGVTKVTVMNGMNLVAETLQTGKPEWYKKRIHRILEEMQLAPEMLRETRRPRPR